MHQGYTFIKQFISEYNYMVRRAYDKNKPVLLFEFFLNNYNKNCSNDVSLIRLQALISKMPAGYRNESRKGWTNALRSYIHHYEDKRLYVTISMMSTELYKLSTLGTEAPQSFRHRYSSLIYIINFLKYLKKLKQ